MLDPGQRRVRMAAPILALLLFAPAVPAKTLTLTDEDADRMAQIAEQAPRSSWAGSELGVGVFYNASFDLLPGRAFLIRFPLEDIPKGQKIIRAELTFPVALANGEQRIQVRRVIGPWGAGVSWKYRAVRPKPVEWTAPGAAAGGKDRVTRPTAIARVTGTTEAVVNLTEDVELWYAGAASNEGWVFTVDVPEGFVRLTSPTWTAAGQWKLRITYEPK